MVRRNAAPSALMQRLTLAIEIDARAPIPLVESLLSNLLSVFGSFEPVYRQFGRVALILGAYTYCSLAWPPPNAEKRRSQRSTGSSIWPCASCKEYV